MTNKCDKVDDYIGKCKPAVLPLLEELRAFIHTTLPGSTEDMQYGVPVFLNTHGVPVLYLFGSKKHVNFGFLRSAELSDPDGILEGSGKPSKHIRIVSGQPVDWASLTGFVTQCESINT